MSIIIPLHGYWSHQEDSGHYKYQWRPIKPTAYRTAGRKAFATIVSTLALKSMAAVSGWSNTAGPKNNLLDNRRMTSETEKLSREISFVPTPNWHPSHAEMQLITLNVNFPARFADAFDCFELRQGSHNASSSG